jgi:hypothetical protein
MDLRIDDHLCLTSFMSSLLRGGGGNRGRGGEQQRRQKIRRAQCHALRRLRLA